MTIGAARGTGGVIAAALIIFFSSCATVGGSASDTELFVGSRQSTKISGGDIASYIGDEAVLDITSDDEGVMHGEISLPVDEDTVLYWNFSAPLKDSAISYSDGTCVTLTYDSAGDFSGDTVYEDGVGSVTLSGEGLVWTDGDYTIVFEQ